MLAVVVRRQLAEKARREILKRKLFDKRRRIVAKGDAVEIPVVSPPSGLNFEYEVVHQENPVFEKPGLSFKELKEHLCSVIGEKAGLIKGGWELIGDVLIISLPEELLPFKRKIGEAILEFHPRARSVVLRQRIEGELRHPRAEVIAGDRNTTTIHRENGVLFKIDPLRVMFSAGNFAERQRMAKISAKDENVLDMFAGIGQLCLPLAKHSSPEEVIAVEKREETFNFLKENIKLNQLDNVKPVLGDNRSVSPEDFADRIIMGYFFSPEKYIDTALRALRGGRGIIHYHTLVKRRELNLQQQKIKKMFREKGFDAEIAYSRTVKSYAPSIYHRVYDIILKKI